MTIYVIRKYRLDIFIVISFLIHFLLAYMSRYIPFAPSLPGKIEPVKVTFLEEKKPAPKPDLKGQVLETPRPGKKERPRSERILSRHNSRMHSRLGKKGVSYRDNRTVIPMNKPAAPSPLPLPAVKRKSPYPEPEPEKKAARELDRVPRARERYHKPSKIVRRESTAKGPAPSVIRKKYHDIQKKNRTADTTAKGPMLMKAPLLDGADLEKYARLDTGAKKGEEPAADSDTISLDTQEFKYVSYFAQIKRKIELVWSYPPEAGRRGLFGKLLMKFTILKDGTLAGINLLDSTGHEILDNEALRAVKMASPYPPFPKRINKAKLNIVASFSYYPSFSLVR